MKPACQPASHPGCPPTPVAPGADPASNARSGGPPGALFTCSVDDGHPNDSRMADLFARHDLQATFYVPIMNREGRPVLGHKALTEIDRHFEIGSHTRDHCFLDRVGRKEGNRQITSGKAALEDIVGHSVNGFCYPGGRFGPAQQRMVEAAGFRFARSTMNLRFDCGSDPFAMPTTIQFYPHVAQVYLRNLLSGGAWRLRNRGLLMALRHPDWLQRIAALFDHACDTGQQFHLWCHSWEIDQLDCWPALDAFFARVARRLSSDRCLTNGALARLTFQPDGRIGAAA
ncbi:MAG: polysaccharide deacetylase family protein [Herminiimonas sp.]|nr:polysaccharide deacetylase family protein [Herminiimonas sp.]